MQNAPAKLKKLKELMDLTTEGLTRAEFVDAFQKVIDYAKKIQDGNEKEWSLIQSAFSMLADKHERLLKDKFDAAHVEHSVKVQKALKGQEDGMKFVYDKVNGLKNGIDGRDGERGSNGRDGKDAKDVDHEQVVADVLAKIPKPKDGKDGKNGHSSATPHPMKVYDLSPKTDGTTKIFTVPKSVSSIVHMSDFPYVLCEGNGYTFNAQRTQITLTVQNAPTSGSQLIFQHAATFNTTT